MEFELNEDQRQLQDSAHRVLNQLWSFDKRRDCVRSQAWHSPALWSALGTLGAFGLLVPTAQAPEGLDGKMEDLWPVLHENAKALSIEPLWSSAVMGTSALALCNSQHAASLWSGVLQGTTVLAWAHDECASTLASPGRGVIAHRSEQGWALTGTKSPVLHGPLAQVFVVSAQVQDRSTPSAPPSLFLVSRSEPGMTARDFRLVDDTPASELQFENVKAQPLMDPHDTQGLKQVMNTLTLRGMAALCVDMLGAMEAAYELTLNYLNVRKQFGRVIGQNQALRHRAAEMCVQLEMCRSVAVAAVVAADRPQDAQSLREVRQAKLLVGQYARALCESAIQCHGGIGMTEDYAVGHCLRRVHVADHLLGHSQEQARLLAQMP